MLLHQITIDRNLENCLAIQNLSCGESYIMMILKLVKVAMDEEQEMMVCYTVLKFHFRLLHDCQIVIVLLLLIVTLNM